MRETWLVAAYWGSRAESVEAAANRLSQSLAALAEVTPQLAQWYHKGYSRAEASTPLPTEGSELCDVLLAGQQHTEEGGHLMPELGYNVSAWNGGNVSFRAKLGATSAHGNNMIIQIGRDAAADFDAATFTAALSALVNAFDSEWATVRTRPHARPQESIPHFGWLTYLRGPARIDGAPSLADGHLYAATSTPQDATVEAVLAVRAAVLNGA